MPLYTTFMHFLNITSMHLLVGLIIIGSIAFIRWRSKPLMWFTLSVMSFACYHTSSIFRDSLSRPDLIGTTALPALILGIGHLLFLISIPHFLYSLEKRAPSKIVTTRSLLLFLLYPLSYLLPGGILRTVGIVPGLVFIGLLLLTALFKMKSPHKSISRTYRHIAWGTVLFTPFLLADLYRYFSICTTLPSVTIYSGILSIFLLRLSILHWKRYESQSSKEKVDTFLEKFSLTARELEIAKAILSGKSNDLIAQEACISIKTVETHCGNIYRKTSVSGRFELFAKIHIN